MIFEESSDRLEEWLDKVMSGKVEKPASFVIQENEIEQ
jgi:hypothetical protein